MSAKAKMWPYEEPDECIMMNPSMTLEALGNMSQTQLANLPEYPPDLRIVIDEDTYDSLGLPLEPQVPQTEGPHAQVDAAGQV
jgi:hypothetical protein